MFKGIIDLESLNDANILNEIKVVKKYEEYHPEANIKHWHGLKIEISDGKIKSFTERISKVIKRDWYAIFWNKDDVFVVFFKKVFKLSREKVKSSNYKEVRDYGIKNNIQEKYMNFQKEIDSWAIL